MAKELTCIRIEPAENGWLIYKSYRDTKAKPGSIGYYGDSDKPCVADSVGEVLDIVSDCLGGEKPKRYDAT